MLANSDSLLLITVSYLLQIQRRWYKHHEYYKKEQPCVCNTADKLQIFPMEGWSSVCLSDYTQPVK